MRCGVYVFGAAAPLGELGLPLTPSAGWTLPEGAQVQCPRGVLAIRGKRHSKRDRGAREEEGGTSLLEPGGNPPDPRCTLGWQAVGKPQGQL